MFRRFFKSLWISVPRATPVEHAEKIRAGQALLVDIREPREWASGVAEGAVLLPLSDLMGARTRWQPFLKTVAGRELVLYCAAGGRTVVAGKILRLEGIQASNGGAFRTWVKSGWRVVRPEAG